MGKGGLVLGAVTLVVGVWLFLFPFIGPSVGMPLYTPKANSSGSAAMMSGSNKSMSGNMTSGSKSGGNMMSTAKSSGKTMSGKTMSGNKSSAGSTMGSMRSTGGSATSGSSAPVVTLNRAAVFVNIIPGVLVAMLGVYLVSSYLGNRRGAPGI